MSRLNSWLHSRLQSVSKSYWKRCYRASYNGWSTQTFHSRCDDLGPTVTIIRAQGYIFGGYTDKSWKWSYGYIYSTRAFIFSLKNYYGYGYFKNDVNAYPSYATYSYYSYGPTFGAGHDIYVADSASSNWNSYFSCHSYTSPYCNSYVWTGNNNFCASEVEVYYEAISPI